ncbi:MAG: hypothetical protein JWR63_1515 [Conexibacter sp.]|nr:hypothetical protein [Conexibacter sp.]
MTAFDGQWAAQVCQSCDPVFATADVGFVRQRFAEDQEDRHVGSIFWEADPAKFADRHPDSGIIESYGEDQWSGVGCIDYWLYVDAEDAICRLSVEGWNLPEILLRATGHGGMDGMAVAAVFARILGVPWPLRG